VLEDAGSDAGATGLLGGTGFGEGGGEHAEKIVARSTAAGSVERSRLMARQHRTARV
jgi:hypothetical protein